MAFSNALSHEFGNEELEGAAHLELGAATSAALSSHAERLVFRLRPDLVLPFQQPKSSLFYNANLDKGFGIDLKRIRSILRQAGGNGIAPPQLAQRNLTIFHSLLFTQKPSLHSKRIQDNLFLKAV